MATIGSEKPNGPNTSEFKAVQQYHGPLVSLTEHMLTFMANHFFTNELISQHELSTAIHSKPYIGATAIINSIMSKISFDSDKYYKFIQVLKTSDLSQDIVENIEKHQRQLHEQELEPDSTSKINLHPLAEVDSASCVELETNSSDDISTHTVSCSDEADDLSKHKRTEISSMEIKIKEHKKDAVKRKQRIKQLERKYQNATTEEERIKRNLTANTNTLTKQLELAETKKKKHHMELEKEKQDEHEALIEIEKMNTQHIQLKLDEEKAIKDEVEAKLKELQMQIEDEEHSVIKCCCLKFPH